MSNIFNSVPAKKPSKSWHNLHYTNLFSCNAAKIIPFYGEDGLPADFFKGRSNVFCRLAPLSVPAFVDYEVFCAYFKVPRRIIEPTFDYFLSGGRSGQSVVRSTCISLYDYKDFVNSNKSNFLVGSLADFLGYPVLKSTSDSFTLKISDKDIAIDLYRVYAYHLICDDYFTDQNLDSPFIVTKDDGTRRTLLEFIDDSDWPDLFAYRRACYRKDSYLTSALPFAQRGPVVSVGLNGQLSLASDGSDIFGSMYDQVDQNINLSTDLNDFVKSDTAASSVLPGLNSQDIADTLSVDGTSASFSIEDFRKAVKIQRWFETNARGGSRLIEMILSHFGVRPKDARMDRPELVGGGKFGIGISDVMQNAPDTTLGNGPLGSYAGKGIGASSSPFFKCFCEEHCYIMGVLVIRPRLQVLNALSRHLMRSDRFDYYFPEFEGLGEQEIMSVEVDYRNYSKANGVFGYAPRYHEYKSHMDEIHGAFRDSMSAWTMARAFSSAPELNSTFMEVPDDNHIFAVTSDDVEHFYFRVDHNVGSNRPMHRFSVPSGLV